MELLKPRGTVEQAIDEEMRVQNFIKDFEALKAKYRVRVDAIPGMKQVNLPTTEGTKMAWVMDAQLKVSTL